MQLAEEPQSLKKKGERNSTLFTLPERTGDRVNPSVVLGTSNLLYEHFLSVTKISIQLVLTMIGICEVLWKSVASVTIKSG